VLGGAVGRGEPPPAAAGRVLDGFGAADACEAVVGEGAGRFDGCGTGTEEAGAAVGEAEAGADLRAGSDGDAGIREALGLGCVGMVVELFAGVGRVDEPAGEGRTDDLADALRLAGPTGVLDAEGSPLTSGVGEAAGVAGGVAVGAALPQCSDFTFR
jgi:hypothetical protein